MAGLLRFRRRQLLTFAGSSVVITVVGVVGLGDYLDGIVRSSTDGANAIARMDLRRDAAPHTILDEPAPNPVPIREGQTRLDRILETEIIRVGFNPDQLPFAFYNDDGDLVGFDIEMAHRLAQELGVVIEFVPFDFDTLPDQLRGDHFDVAMSGVQASFWNLQAMVMAFSGLEVTGALVVPDHLRNEVASVDAIRDFKGFKVGVIGESRLSSRFHDRLPDAEVVQLDNHSEFFEGPREDVTALVTTAEAGAAWTLRYPNFDVVVPDGVDVRTRIIYPIGGEDFRFRSYVERWARLAGDEGTIDELYEHWILGRGAVQSRPRWSVIRDVLGWVE